MAYDSQEPNIQTEREKKAEKKQWHTRGSTNKEYGRTNFSMAISYGKCKHTIYQRNQLTIHNSYMLHLLDWMWWCPEWWWRRSSFKSQIIFIYLFWKLFYTARLMTDDDLNEICERILRPTVYWMKRNDANKNLFFFICFVLASFFFFFLFNKEIIYWKTTESL